MENIKAMQETFDRSYRLGNIFAIQFILLNKYPDLDGKKLMFIDILLQVNQEHESYPLSLGFRNLFNKCAEDNNYPIKLQTNKNRTYYLKFIDGMRKYVKTHYDTTPEGKQVKCYKIHNTEFLEDIAFPNKKTQFIDEIIQSQVVDLFGLKVKISNIDIQQPSFKLFHELIQLQSQQKPQPEVQEFLNDILSVQIFNYATAYSFTKNYQTKFNKQMKKNPSLISSTYEALEPEDIRKLRKRQLSRIRTINWRSKRKKIEQA